MARQNINIGTSPNDGTGDDLRTAFTKSNSNFTELYNNVANITVNYGDSNVASYLPTYSGNLGGTITTAVQPNITRVGNLTVANVAGNATVTGTLTTTGPEIVNVNVANITGDLTYTLSSATPYNIFYCTANANVEIFPPTSVSDGQVVVIGIHGNTAPNLSTGSGTWSPAISGITSIGTSYKYVYKSSGIAVAGWYKIC